MGSTSALTFPPETSTSTGQQSGHDDQPLPGEGDDDDNDAPWTFDPAKLARHRRIRAESTAPTFHPRSPIHVGGTPGTGKTAFGSFLLHKLLERYPECAFVYRHGDVDPGCFLYYDGTSYYHRSIVEVFSDNLLVALLTKNNTKPIWTLLDGAAAIPTGTAVARMIVLTSPGQQTIPLKHLLKHATTIVNPPWTLNEVLKVRKVVYPYLSEASVKLAFEQWGGIPRILFDYAKKPDKLQELQDSIGCCDPFVLVRQAGLPPIDHAKVSGLHFHLVPAQKVQSVEDATEEDILFRYPAYCWATTWMQEQFWEALRKEQGEDSILRFLLNRTNISAARGYVFETHVFHTIEHLGFSGRLRILREDGVEEGERRSIEPMQRRTFSSFQELPTEAGAHANTFYVPVQTNRTSVDFYIPDMGMLVQVNLGHKPGIKQSGLDEAVNSGLFDEWKTSHPDEKLRLVFLCDSFSFQYFRKKPYLTNAATTVKSENVLNDLNEKFDQYAWEMDVGKQLAFQSKETKKSRSRAGRAATGWDEPIEVLPEEVKGKGTDLAMTNDTGVASSGMVTRSKRKLGELDL